MSDSDLTSLAQDIESLTAQIRQGAQVISARWEGWVERPDVAPSAENLAAWLALRHNDLRPLQERLMVAGLSSLGRAEARVMPTLQALGHVLGAATGWGATPAPDLAAFFQGRDLIHSRAQSLLGALSPESPVRLMVTLPSEAAQDRGFLIQLAKVGVEAVRINCAHDDESAWEYGYYFFSMGCLDQLFRNRH
jgi:pyruvate kinase